jgi:hypothetical protein
MSFPNPTHNQGDWEERPTLMKPLEMLSTGRVSEMVTAVSVG